MDNLLLLPKEARKKIYNDARKTIRSEFEALMRMLDNEGFRTGYVYRHQLVNGDPPKPNDDIEMSLDYILREEEEEEEELCRQGWAFRR